MNIIKKKLKLKGGASEFSDLMTGSKFDGIALHHMAHNTWTFDEVHAYHRDTKGWQGIAYGWWIDFDGTIYEGRGFHMNAGVLGHNDHLLSIGFRGNFEPGAAAYSKTMTDAQFNAGIDLINWLKPQLPNLRVIHGHRHWTSTACPGQFFPLTEMVAGKKRGVVTLEPKTEFKDVPAGHWAEDAIKIVSNAGIMNGLPDGTFGLGKTVTREELAAIIATTLAYTAHIDT